MLPEWRATRDLHAAATANAGGVIGYDDGVHGDDATKGALAAALIQHVTERHLGS